MNKYPLEKLVGKFNVLKSGINMTEAVTALEGFTEDGGEGLKEVNLSIIFENGNLALSYTVEGKTQTKLYYVPESCETLNPVKCGLTEGVDFDINFETNNKNKAYLHLRYGDDGQIDNEIIELIGEDEECEVFPDSEGYWLIEDLLELE